MSTLNLLRIDTSADYCHNDRINAVFADKIHDCDGFDLINLNKTSWTASRVGITAVRAWAFALNKPIYENGKLVDIHKLEPYYDAEFQVAKKN